MGSTGSQTIQSGLDETCWRGVRIGHPAEWEPARLSGPGEPGQCVFVDRAYQRLEVHWRALPRPPDLKQMYKRLARTYKDQHNAPLTGAGGWEGLLRTERTGQVVHAGRYFPDRKWLIETVITWPGRRDPDVERAVLAALAPLAKGPTARWRALGLHAVVEADMELVQASSKVGRVAWRFVRARRKSEGLLVERLAMPGTWLRKPIEEWLAEELPPGYKTLGDRQVSADHDGAVEVDSRMGNPLWRLLRRATARVDRAWICPDQDRLYHVAWWRRGRHPVAWPRELAVPCCRTIEPAAER